MSISEETWTTEIEIEKRWSGRNLGDEMGTLRIPFGVIKHGNGKSSRNGAVKMGILRNE